VGHTGAAQSLYQSLFDDAFLNIQGQLAATLLGSTPANAVGKTTDILNFLNLNPLTLFRDGSGTVVRTLLHNTHVFYFV
jgi:hypothetical protein